MPANNSTTFLFLLSIIKHTRYLNRMKYLLTYNRFLKSIHFYTELSSCFLQASCGDVVSITTEPSCPQASIRVKLTLHNNCSKQIAALWSRSITVPHSEQLYIL